MEQHVEIESRANRIDAIAQENAVAANSLERGAGRRVRMTLNQFSSFAAVAKYMSVSKASEELGVSQPTISLQLKQLENHHGTKLYRRVNRGIEITEAGRVFLRSINPILDQIAKLEGGVKPAAPKSAREVLRVGGTECVSAELLPSLLAGFRQRHPAADLDLRTGTSDHLERMVSSSLLDLAVTVREPRSAALACEPLRREKIAMFVPSDHPLARKSRLQLSQVVAEPVITRGGRGSSGVVDSALKRIRDLGLDLKIGMHCDDPTAIKSAVRRHMGVGVAFEDAVLSEVASGEFKILKVPRVELEGESYIIYSKKRKLSPLALEFLELLRSERTSRREIHSAARQAARSRRRREPSSIERATIAW